MAPAVFSEKHAIRQFSREQRRQGKMIGFVPTMGYLHEGHISLVQAARERCDVVIASIYINPTQFSKNEDFGKYPRSTEDDLRKLEAAGCAAVFMPSNLYHTPSSGTSSSSSDQGGSTSAADSNAALVVGVGDAATRDPSAHETWVQVEHLSRGLCARSRPHFFRGVCTVVAKLFHVVEPDLAFFGKKDYQQWRVLERMVRDLDFGLEVVGMPIVREADGLAMSSRNALLTPEDRQRAVCIPRALQAAAEAAAQNRAGSAAELQQQVASAIEAGGGRVDYAEVVDARTLQPVSEVRPQRTLIAVAAFFGSVRLIDNIEV